jgi:hypothetical protein
MLAPSTGRIGGCRWFLVCAEAETTNETNKSTSIGTRRCTAAPDKEVLACNATRIIHYATSVRWSVRGVTERCDVVGANGADRVIGSHELSIRWPYLQVPACR